MVKDIACSEDDCTPSTKYICVEILDPNDNVVGEFRAYSLGKFTNIISIEEATINGIPDNKQVIDEFKNIILELEEIECLDYFLH